MASEVTTKKELTPVVVTTQKGVFFGYADSFDINTEHIRLTNVRMAVRWWNTHGVLGLAAAGPNADCRISPSIPALTIKNLTSISEVTEAAVKAWESEPWSK